MGRIGLGDKVFYIGLGLLVPVVIIIMSLLILTNTDDARTARRNQACAAMGKHAQYEPETYLPIDGGGFQVHPAGWYCQPGWEYYSKW